MEHARESAAAAAGARALAREVESDLGAMVYSVVLDGGKEHAYDPTICRAIQAACARGHPTVSIGGGRHIAIDISDRSKLCQVVDADPSRRRRVLMTRKRLGLELASDMIPEPEPEPEPSPFFASGILVEVRKRGAEDGTCAGTNGRRGHVLGRGRGLGGQGLVRVALDRERLDHGVAAADGPLELEVLPTCLFAVPRVGNVVEAANCSRFCGARGVVTSVDGTDPGRRIVVEFAPSADGDNKREHKLLRTRSVNMRVENLVCSPEPRCHPEPETLHVLHVSDTHRMLFPEVLAALPSADVLIHTGDFTEHGKAPEFEQFNRNLESVADKFPFRIVILGNHELKCHAASAHHFEGGFDTVAQHREFLAPLTSQLSTGATHVPVCDEVVVPPGLRIFGCSWWCGHQQASGHGGAPQPKLRGVSGLANVPPWTDILLTHTPPWGILDFGGSKGQKAAAGGGVATGARHCASLVEVRTVVDTVRPGLHLFGHVHESNGVHQHGSTLCINGSMANWASEPEAELRHEAGRRRCNRLQFVARLIEASRLSAAHAWRFRVVEEVDVDAASREGWRNHDADRRAAAKSKARK